MNDSQCSEVALEFNRHIINLLDSLSALSELAALSIHDFDEPQLLKQALGALMSNQDMERCSIFLLGEGGLLMNAAGLDWEGMLRGLTYAEEAEPALHARTQYRLGEGIMGRAAETGTIQHCRSCADDPQFKKFGPGDIPVEGALLCVPITCEGRVLGVLNIFYPQAGFFNMWHERLVLLFCQVLGRLLLNHRFTYHLSALLDDRTQEVMAANIMLREEAALRQEAQEKLAHQYGFLQSVMDGTPEPIMVIGRDYRLLMANAPARKNAPPMAEGQSWTCHQVSHHRDTPCDGAEHQCPLQMVIAQNGPASVIHEHFDAAGEPRLIELLAAPLRDKDGAIIGIIESARDITERKRVEGALRESEEKFRLISTSAKDAMVIIGPAEEITYWNPAAESTFGYPADEALGRNLHQLIAPSRHHDEAHRKFAHFSLSGEGPLIGKTLEITALRKNGEEFPIELSISAMRMEGKWHALGIIRDITERKKTEEQIRQLAFYDTLTDLPNRRMLIDRLHQALAQAKRHQRALAVMFLDLDRFKLINDMRGHDVGDELLKEVATRLNACVRSGDTVSRQGGDEFIIVLAEVANPSDVALVAEKIIGTVGQPISINGHELQITTSIGIALFPVNGTDDAQELMKKADMAMYAAKEAGRNGYRFYPN